MRLTLAVMAEAGEGRHFCAFAVSRRYACVMRARALGTYIVEGRNVQGEEGTTSKAREVVDIRGGRARQHFGT